MTRDGATYQKNLCETVKAQYFRWNLYIFLKRILRVPRIAEKRKIDFRSGGSSIFIGLHIDSFFPLIMEPRINLNLQCYLLPFSFRYEREEKEEQIPSAVLSIFLSS